MVPPFQDDFNATLTTFFLPILHRADFEFLLICSAVFSGMRDLLVSLDKPLEELKPIVLFKDRIPWLGANNSPIFLSRRFSQTDLFL